ncbi:hypothetical protein DYBT9275_00337 [Dyadobacter sp. CECT 9275]|uniref:Uncharacterized protein n=1 Tax=Dyadobacter helix TaxID=2822344 RepID=A0A916NAC3_9BACT|nr:hypothetical protein DYBT9275_00337 [Dyadobacter sp. CECT 9275]
MIRFKRTCFTHSADKAGTSYYLRLPEALLGLLKSQDFLQKPIRFKNPDGLITTRKRYLKCSTTPK